MRYLGRSAASEAADGWCTVRQVEVHTIKLRGIMKGRFVLLLLAGPLACAGQPQPRSAATPAPSPSPATPAAASSAIPLIEEAGRQFSAAYVRGDAAAMAALYTDDAVIFPERSAAIRGRADIERYWTLQPGRRITLHRLMPDEVVVEDSTAYDHGRFEVAGVTNGEAWGPSEGKYLVVWKRGDDGRWRMHLDMWNSGPRQGGS